VENWGTKHNDIGILASFNECPIGAVWCRQIKGYGFVNESISELAMGFFQIIETMILGVCLSKIEKACALANV
jgi:hypothetical protein